MTIRFAAAMAVVLTLGGCAATYTYDGKLYNSKPEFLAAVDSSSAEAVRGIAPLPQPLSKKTLVFAVPSRSTIVKANLANHAKLHGSQAIGLQVEMYEALADASIRGTRVFYDAIARKNIFAAVKFVELDSLTASPAAGADQDILYWYEPTQGNGTWYYSSFKSGRQVFAFDKAKPTMRERVEAFVQAVQLQAIRE